MQGARRNAKPGAKSARRNRPAFGARRGASRPRRRRRASRPRRWTARHPWLYRGIKFSLLASIWGTLLLSLAVIYFIARVPDPTIAALDDRPPNVTVLAEDGTVLAERGLRRGHVRLDVLPPYLVQAVLATEDRRFYSHWGIDPVGLIRASYRNAAAGAVVEGGSTITQQLAKNLFLRPERTITRKLEEVVYAIWLEQRFSKQEILELYINRVYFGGGTYGVEAASRRYFGRSSRFVTLPQAALLAGLLKAPSRYAPTRSVKAANARVEEVLTNMVEAGYLSEDQAHTASKQPLRLSAKGDDTGYPYAVDWVAELLPEFIGEHNNDLIVETTIDAGLQRIAQRGLRQLLDSEGKELAAGEGAVVVLDPFGGVKALVGGRSYSRSPFDRALKAQRQPGSAFKPFVYLAALESGYRPDSVAYDGPTTIAGWSPRNYTGTYHGEISLRDALAHSTNTVAARLTAEVGPWRVVRTARRLGIQSRLHDRPSIALGTAEVNLLELVGAYAPFANGGQGVLPHIVTRVRNGDGKVIYQRRRSTTGQVVALQFVGGMNEMMNATMRWGTGKQAAIEGHVSGGKTGTTQSFRDAWFVGYTAHYVGGVWMGNDNGRRMKKVTGGTLPAKLWQDVMTYAHRDKAPAPLPGLRTPWVGNAVARLPWNAPSQSESSDESLYRRVLGIFAGE
ncbi:MAG TPA: PBP1A family penicillin-binding protein [Methyloceanibacter sp.]|nr:PBP1A family penicillin-binding protein [Methyloceanibacter sp.]